MEAPIAAIDTVVQTEELISSSRPPKSRAPFARPSSWRSLEPLALDPLEVDAVYRMFEERGDRAAR